MIPVEYPYGWGVYSLPMLRDISTGPPLVPPPVYPTAGLVRTLADETPWRRVLLSILLACLSLLLLLVLKLSHQEPLLPSEPEPVVVAVILPQEVPQPPPPAVVEMPKPARKQTPLKVQKLEVQEPPIQKPPVQEPPPVARKAPVSPPKPPPVRKAPTVETPLPQPSRVSPRLPEQKVEARKALPSRKAEVSVQSEVALPAAQALASYDQTPRQATTAALPQQRSSFSTDDAVPEVVAQLAPKRVTERRPARASLPSKATVALGSPAAAELNAVDTGLSNVRYDTPRQAQSLPASTRMASLATSRGAEADIGSPQMNSVNPGISERAAASEAPVSGRALVTIPAAGTEEALIGPTATVRATAPGAPVASNLPVDGGSFDFLDSMASSELDRSFMVSLNRLRTCRDPAEEKKLKTSLAALLSQPAMCRSGGVVFDIRNPESAYSIHVDLYNYEQREFQDRCDALRLAVQSCEARR